VSAPKLGGRICDAPGGSELLLCAFGFCEAEIGVCELMFDGAAAAFPIDLVRLCDNENIRRKARSSTPTERIKTAVAMNSVGWYKCVLSGRIMLNYPIGPRCKR